MSFESQLIHSSTRIASLSLRLRPLAWALMGAVRYRLGVWLVVTQGRRNHEEQGALWAKGRDGAGNIVAPADVVTYARAGQSNHEYGEAFDVARLHPEDGRVSWDDLDWGGVGTIGEEVGLRWGGRWQHKDRPHFENPDAPIARSPLVSA